MPDEIFITPNFSGFKVAIFAKVQNITVHLHKNTTQGNTTYHSDHNRIP